MRNIAAFTIRNNQRDNMEVSHLVIGYSRVKEFYENYFALPESKRRLGEYDIFVFDSIEEALEDHIDVVSNEATNDAVWHNDGVCDYTLINAEL
jgi:hypothetical protein